MIKNSTSFQINVFVKASFITVVANIFLFLEEETLGQKEVSEFEK